DMTRILDELAAGRQPKTGTQAPGRHTVEPLGGPTTLTAMALRGRRCHVVHVGDSRAWRFSAGRLARLTTDHVRPEP
ncbi:hypothetical protein ACE4ZU_27020, partial [Salmonella enterica]|uniref:hypothetical protein n=1 Tax=Salmonella enterica TaxID=28901 RepID=UPI003D2E10F3